MITSIPLLIYAGMVGVWVVPLEVKEAAEEISQGRPVEAHSRLTAFMTTNSDKNHHAWAYRALANARMGNVDQARLDAVRSSDTKWRFGNRDGLNLRFFAAPNNCAAIVDDLPLPKTEQIYLVETLCVGPGN